MARHVEFMTDLGKSRRARRHYFRKHKVSGYVVENLKILITLP
jgi:hypothetical protein